MSDYRETREGKEPELLRRAPEEKLSPRAVGSIQGDVVAGANEPVELESKEPNAEATPNTPPSDASSLDQPPEGPSVPDSGGDAPPDQPQEGEHERPTIRPKKSPEHLPEPEKPSVTPEVLGSSGIKPPEGWHPSGAERRG